MRTIVSIALGVQVAEDDANAALAVLMLFYKYPGTPTLQLMLSLQRTRAAGGDGFDFTHINGMPLTARLRVKPLSASQCELTMSVAHAVPAPLDKFVGQSRLKAHVRTILTENLKVRSLLYRQVPAGTCVVVLSLRRACLTLLMLREESHQHMASMQVMQLLLEGKLDRDGLWEYYQEHRSDEHDGLAQMENKESLEKMLANGEPELSFKLEEGAEASLEASLEQFQDLVVRVPVLSVSCQPCLLRRLQVLRCHNCAWPESIAMNFSAAQLLGFLRHVASCMTRCARDSMLSVCRT